MTVSTHLSTLETSGLIRLAELQPEMEYLFRHAMVQDAAYESLLRQDRKRLHRRIAAVLEENYPERIDELASILAYHYLEAGEHPLAIHYLRVAGDRAFASYANSEAEGYYRAALKLHPDANTEASLLEALGEVLDVLSRYDEAESIWRMGIELYRSLDDLDGVARLYASLARTVWSTGNYGRALQISEEGLQSLPSNLNSVGYARLLLRFAGNLRFNARPLEGLEPCQQALEIAHQLGDRGLLAEGLLTQGYLVSNLNEREQALREAVEIAVAAKLLRTAYRACNNLGVTQAYLGRHREAHATMMRAVDLAQRQGDVMAMLQSISNAAIYAALIGELRNAARLIEVMQSLMKQVTRNSRMEWVLRVPQSVVCNLQGHLAQEREILRPLAQHSTPADYYEYENWILLSALNHEKWQEVAEILERSKLPDPPPAPHVIMLRQVLTAWLHREMGDLILAREWIDRARAVEIATIRTDSGFVIRQVEAFQMAAEGDWEGAVHEVEAIEASPDFREMRVERAIFRFNWARTIARWGQPSNQPHALEIMHTERAEFELMGAEGWVTIIDQRIGRLMAEQGLENN